MKYKIIMTKKAADELKAHLLTDRTKEQMAVTLCGINRLKKETRFLVRHVILMPPEAFASQSSAYLELNHAVQRQILALSASENLSQIDWHSHPGESPYIGFSGTDDRNEKELAIYLSKKLPHISYGSVVVNNTCFDARVWHVSGNRIATRPVELIRWGDFNDEYPVSNRGKRFESDTIDERFSRQVAAFGTALQTRLKDCRIGVIGVGGLGGIIVEMLARLGCDNWVLVDDDVVERSNLNRLPGSSVKDAYFRTNKVSLTQRNISKVNPHAKVVALPLSVTDPKAIQALKSCDLLVASTDNNASRLIANRVSVQYLIPLLHTGVNIDVDEEKNITDISGEHVLPPLGQWCLQCGGIIDSQQAAWELADENMRKILRERGYIKDTVQPAVYHLNSVIASLAVAEIHNFIYPYKPVRRYLTYDELKGEILSLEMATETRCPVCDAEEGYLGLGDIEPLPKYEATNKPLPLPIECDEREDEGFVPLEIPEELDHVSISDGEAS